MLQYNEEYNLITRYFIKIWFYQFSDIFIINRNHLEILKRLTEISFKNVAN
jgi:hypothetical protein